MKRLSRWSMAIVATFVLALSLVGGLAKQALADTTPVTSEAELLAAIAAAPSRWFADYRSGKCGLYHYCSSPGSS